MLRSHHVAYKFDEEVEIKKSLLADNKGRYEQPVFGKLILFMTLFEVSTTCASICTEVPNIFIRHLRLII
jgi:hypothetical protein